MKKHFHTSIAILLLIPSISIAKGLSTTGPFKIIPFNISPLTITSANKTYLTYSVTNTTGVSIKNIVINAGFGIPSNLLTIGVSNNTCTTPLNPYGQCDFTVSLQGKGIAGTATLMPKVCGISGVTCSVPAATYQIPLTVITGSGLSPHAGVVSGGQTITINGVFGANPSVTFDGNAATIISASATQIVLKTPANSYAGGAGGKMVDVVITTSSGTIKLPNSYTYVGLNDPYENGVIFHLDGNGNPGGTVVSTTDDGPNITWTQANTYCASYAGGGYTGWRLPNTYAYGAAPTDGGPITGEPGVLYNNNNPYAGMSVNNAYWGSNDTTVINDGNHAWMENFGGGAQLSVPKSLTSGYLYARCVRDFSN